MFLVNRLRARAEPTEDVVVRFVSWLLTNIRERRFSLVRLVPVLFLLDWRLTQQTGRSVLRLNWQFDGEKINAPGLLDRFAGADRLLVETDTSLGQPVVVLAGKFDQGQAPPEASLAAGHLEDLLGRTPSSLLALARETYPIRATPKGRVFTLDDRYAAWQRSRGL